MLDGGTRLLGRVLPIGRGWRLTIVTLAAVGFVVWTFYYAGTELVAQTERLKETISGQIDRIFAWAGDMGLVQGGVRHRAAERPADGHAGPARLGGVDRARRDHQRGA